jgi:hypothetical protein
MTVCERPLASNVGHNNKEKLLKKIFLSLAIAFANQAFAQDSQLLKKIEDEEKTWHKYFVFTTAVSAAGSDREAVLEWLRNRIESGKASDSRYAVAYSRILWQSGKPELMEEAITYAVAGYTALQIESARCETRNESIQIARQWYDPVKPQLQKYISLPKEKKDSILPKALEYAERLSSTPANGSNPGSDWICYLLPSYSSKIIGLPDVIVDTRSQGAFAMKFISHPTVKPVASGEQKFADQKKKIIDEIKTW